jgi:hypothetical protein
MADAPWPPNLLLSAHTTFIRTGISIKSNL